MNITISKSWLLSWSLFLFSFFINEIKAQDKRPLVFVATDNHQETLKKITNKVNIDSAGAIRLINEVVQNLHARGYLTAGLDSMAFFPLEIKAYMWIGHPYQWAKLEPGNVGEALLSFAGFKKNFFDGRTFHYPEVSNLFEKILKYSENNGYPFATVALDSISIDENQINARIHYTKGPYIAYDSLAIYGSSKIKKKFLASYLRVIQGQPYEEYNFNAISSKLKRLPYLRLAEPPQVTFQNNEGTIHLNLEDKKVNQIDGIIGFFPNAGNDNKLLLTGQFNLFLQNMFGSGKALRLEWQKIKPLSQLLEADYFHPNILASPINVATSFYLLKEDTTFINRDAQINLSINKGLYSSIRAYTKIRTSSLLSTSQFKNHNSLPDFADFTLNSYGVGYQFRKLDDFFFPTKGQLLELDGSIGNKRIKKNGGLPEEIYEGVSDRSMQLSFSAEFSNFMQVKRRFVLLNKVKGGIVENEQLFLNDLFRIGGLQSLRGFNENFFFASRFFTATCEVRMMLDQQSFLMLFADQGILKYNLTNKDFLDYPTGVGLGLNLALEGGIFNFVYAVGGAKSQPMNFQGSKIHFGYISRF